MLMGGDIIVNIKHLCREERVNGSQFFCRPQLILFVD